MSKASEAQAAIEDAIDKNYQAVNHHLNELHELMSTLRSTSEGNLEKVARAVAAIKGCSFRSAPASTPTPLRHSDVIPAEIVESYEERQRSAS